MISRSNLLHGLPPQSDGARPTEVGALRTLKWSEGETVTQRLLELSDLERRVVWETVAAEPSSEVTAAITTLQAHRITENNGTLLSWYAYFLSTCPNLTIFVCLGRLSSVLIPRVISSASSKRHLPPTWLRLRRTSLSKDSKSVWNTFFRMGNK